MQDSDGFLWVGTWSGLIRYDGITSQVFLAETLDSGSLQSNKITALSEDLEGNIWVATRTHGVFIFDQNQQVFSNFSANTPGLETYLNVWDIEHRQDGTIWLATEAGLIKIRDNIPTVYTTADGLSHNFITSIFSDKSENLWVTTESGLNKIESGDEWKVSRLFYPLDPQNYELHNYFYECASIFYGGEETIYISSQKGMKELRDGELINHEIDSENGGFNLFRSLMTIQSGNPIILIGSDMGLNTFDPISKSFIGFYGNFDKQVNLSHNTVTDIYMDDSEVLWVGTKKGINKLDTYDKGVELYPNHVYDPTQSIVTGINGVAGQIYLSTIGNGLFNFDPKRKTFSRLEIPRRSQSDFTDFIQKLEIDKAGKIYLGLAGGGIVRFDPEVDVVGGKVVRYESITKGTGKLSDNYIMSLANSNDEGVWIGTWSGGLNKVLSDASVIQYESEILKKTPIVSLYESKGFLWIGTRGEGLVRFDIADGVLQNPKFFGTRREKKISSDFVSDILEDSEGRIWVATEEGLNIYSASCDCFEMIRKVEGLSINEVTSILEDNNGNFWLANWNGLGLMKYQDNELKKIDQFDRSDRLQGGFFYDAVAFAAEDGSLYFGGSNGFNIIDSRELIKNPHVPKTAITSISIFDTPLMPGQFFNDRVIFSNRIQETDKIELNYFENSISFEFASLHFAAPDKNKFKFKLDGFDENWNDTNQTRPYAVYTNLSEGSYIFKVKSCNNDGLWQEEPLELVVVILPPWWKTWIAYMGFGLLLALLLIGFRYLIIARTTYENNIKLERVKGENLLANNKAKLKFFTNVAHEFRTPLTLIVGPVENLVSDENTGKYAKQQLTVIRNNTNRLLKLINQLLDFRKIETGNMEIKAAKGNFVQFVKEIKLSFETQAELSEIKFEFFSSSNIIELYFDRDQFEKIIYNLLSNSFKNTPKGGTIAMKIVEQSEQVELIVEDNGRGIPKGSLDKVLDRFYTSDVSSLTGTGIGLALVNNLIKLHHGTLEYDSVPNEKTVFKVLIKKGSDHFGEDDLMANFQNSELIHQYEELSKYEGLEDSEDSEESKDIAEFDRVLVVEDNDDVRAFIKSIFIRNHVVLEASNGEEGLKLALDEVPDLVISDVMMPIMDGIELCKLLKTDQKTSHIPVILLTARTSLIFKVDGYESGADDYISKPFKSKLLKLRVSNLIKQRKKLREIYGSGKNIEIEPSLVSYTSADETFVQTALESIEKNMSNSEYTVEDLGRDVAMSRMQLYRKLKAMLGQSANEFIRTIRLKRAAQLLKANEFTIAEITYMCGFTDLQYFRQCFKKQFGINPSEYLNEGEGVEEDSL